MGCGRLFDDPGPEEYTFTVIPLCVSLAPYESSYLCEDRSVRDGPVRYFRDKGPAKVNPTHTRCHRHRAELFAPSRSILGRVFPMPVGPARSAGPTDMGEIPPKSDLGRKNGPARCRGQLVWVGLVSAERI